MQSSAHLPSVDLPQNKGYSFRATHPIIPNLSIYNGIKLLTLGHSNKVAIDCLSLKASYKQLFQDTVTISCALKALHVSEGDIISVCMPNYYQAVVIFLACNRIGAVVTFLSDEASMDEICAYLKLYKSPIFFNFDKDVTYNQHIKNASSVKHIVTLYEKNLSDLNLMKSISSFTHEGFIDFHSLGTIAHGQKKGIPTNKSAADALILYTSGTTGEPKPVVLTNRNVIAAGIYLQNSSSITTLNIDKCLACVPFSYPYGLVTSTVMTLLSAKTAILAPNISAQNVQDSLQKKPSVIFGSPALLELIMRNAAEDLDLSSVKSFISGGDFLTLKHYARGKEFFAKHGAPDVDLGNGSGNAETVSCGTNPTGVKPKPSTAGKVLTGTKAMIVDESMHELPYHEVGQLLVSGKHVFKEYYNMPEKTKDAKVTIQGTEYFKTGTLGFLDEEGYFTIVGRSSRFYITAGLKKVYMDHIQEVCASIPGVQDCALVEVDDETELYKGVLFVVPDSDIAADESFKNTLLEAVAKPIKTASGRSETLKPFERPSYISFISELPRRKGMSKIDYSALKERGNAIINQ